uniref:Uncharacterized protein n=1 Tax=Candidozyma auris TaxID=498019 RepID=A0A0L0NWL5_CANAR
MSDVALMSLAASVELFDDSVMSDSSQSIASTNTSVSSASRASRGSRGEHDTDSAASTKSNPPLPGCAGVLAMAACAPVVCAVTAQATASFLRDPRAELSYIIARDKDKEPEFEGAGTKIEGGETKIDREAGEAKIDGGRSKIDEEADEAKIAADETDVELVTFSSKGCKTPPDEEVPVAAMSRCRSREARANLAFLRLYAHDTSARYNRVLGAGGATGASTRQWARSLRQFDKEHDLARILALSTRKLWDGVVLPPRSDPLPRRCANWREYVRTEDGARRGALVMERRAGASRVVPWAPHRQWLRPAGELVMGKRVVQYTVKGWAPERARPAKLGDEVDQL